MQLIARVSALAMALVLASPAFALPSSIPFTPIPPINECEPTADEGFPINATYISYLYWTLPTEESKQAYPQGFQYACPANTLQEVWTALVQDLYSEPTGETVKLCPGIGNNTSVLAPMLRSEFTYLNGTKVIYC